jgi:cytoskeletal protein RodZ
MMAGDVPDDERSGEPAWHQRPEAMVAAGLAGLVAIGLLVFAVILTSRHSITPPGTDVPLTSTSSSSSRHGSTSKSTTTSYTTLTVTLTQATSSETSTTEATQENTDTATTTAGTTTMSVPYPTTTTQRNNV